VSPTVDSARRPTPIRHTPFGYTRPPRPRSWLDRLFKRPRPDLAAEALQHLLARRDATRIAPTDISELFLRYGVVGADARAILVATWRRVLHAFLGDDVLSDREIAYLQELARALTLTTQDVEAAEREVIHPRYEKAVSEAMADERMTAEERAALARLAARLRLQPEVEREIYHRSARRVLDAILRETLADHRVSPEELERMTHVAREFGVELRPQFWRIENGDLPTVEAKLGLELGEVCHFRTRGEWFERRSGVVESDEGIGSTRIARGVYFRAGSMSTESLDRTRLTEGEEGTLLITNRQVIFDGRRRQRAVPLRTITAFQVHADGLVLERRGAAPDAVIAFGEDVELAAVVLGAALARA
jgi:hypothetical protein